MGHIKEPNGITLLVEKQNLTSEIEEKIKNFIKKSKEKNKRFLESMKETVE